MRVTLRNSVDRGLQNIQHAQERLFELENRVATGKRITRPSDDPTGIARALGLRSSLKLGAQHLRNADSGTARLTATEVTLATLTDVLHRAGELALAGANSTTGPDQLAALAAEIDQLLEESIALGNAKFGSQYIFAGHQSTTAPFTPAGSPTTAVTYGGDAGVVEREVGPGVRVPINVAGDVAISPIHTALIGLRDSMLAGNTTAVGTTDLAAVDAALSNLLQIRGRLGATTNRLEITRSRVEEVGLAEKQELSALEDADILEAIVSLQAQENVFAAALAATARTTQVSLLDFIR